MKVIYANIIWFTAILFGLVGAAMNRRSGPDWESMPDVRTNYDVLYGILGIYLVVCIVGLLIKKSWGYSAAVSANVTLSMLPIGIFVASLFMLMPDITFIEILNINLGNLLVGLVSIVFWVLLVKSNIKSTYVQKII